MKRKTVTAWFDNEDRKLMSIRPDGRFDIERPYHTLDELRELRDAIDDALSFHRHVPLDEPFYETQEVQ